MVKHLAPYLRALRRVSAKLDASAPVCGVSNRRDNALESCCVHLELGSETRARIGIPGHDDGSQDSAGCPIEVELTSSKKKKILLECGISQWRDPDSNRGHHDFQSWAGISLTTLKSLQVCGFSTAAIASPMLANCGRLLRIWALGCGSVPNGFPANSGGACPNQRRVVDLLIHNHEMMNA
jgi:hypothetical protein